MKILKAILGVILAILAVFGFYKYSPDDAPTELNNRKKELEDKLDDLDQQEEDLQKDGVDDLDDSEVVDYWKDK